MTERGFRRLLGHSDLVFGLATGLSGDHEAHRMKLQALRYLTFPISSLLQDKRRRLKTSFYRNSLSPQAVDVPMVWPATSRLL